MCSVFTIIFYYVDFYVTLRLYSYYLLLTKNIACYTYLNLKKNHFYTTVVQAHEQNIYVLRMRNGKTVFRGKIIFTKPKSNFKEETVTYHTYVNQKRLYYNEAVVQVHTQKYYTSRMRKKTVLTIETHFYVTKKLPSKEESLFSGSRS